MDWDSPLAAARTFCSQGRAFYGGLSFLEYGGQGGGLAYAPVSSVATPVGGSYHSLAYGIEGGYAVRFFDRLTFRA
jgi:hypothetical protein